MTNSQKKLSRSPSARPVAIVGGIRTPFVKSFSQYSRVSNQELMTTSLKQLVQKYNLRGQILGEVALGAVMKNASDFNLSRESLLDSGLDPHTPGYDLTRACGTSLEAAAQIALKISAGQIESGIAGGTDTNSDIQGVFSKKFSHLMLDLNKAKSVGQKLQILLKISPTDFAPQFPTVAEPRTGKSMGQHCELMVQEWQISQREQDELALVSHKNAAKAYEDGFYKDLVFEFKGLQKDPLVRGDTSIEKLSKLKPAFDFSGKGTLTAGNSTPLTDGSSAVLLTSEEYAQRKNLPILAYFIDAQSAAVDFVGGEGLLMAPTIAVSEMLKRNGITLQDFDFYEIHEAFAGQALCTLKAWESANYCKEKLGRSQAMGSIDRSKLNIKGGSVALGHPFAATGTRILASLAKMINDRGSGRGLISVCTAGGMGVAAIIEK
ncbi:MAG: acetyl-CoA C-acetyltransferase [Pseudobdellovibrionaceae bacterium]